MPVYQEGTFTLTDSHAINAYLVGTRSPGNNLYPTDLKERAVVDSRLYYDSTMIFPKMTSIFVSLLQTFLKMLFDFYNTSHENFTDRYISGRFRNFTS